MVNIKHRLVLIADRVNDHDPSDNKGLGFERLSDFYFENLVEALESNFDLIILESPEELIENISEFKNDIVLSLWSGERSRSRRAFIPSICEAYKIRYIGADPYTQTLCQDKHLTKSFLNEFGFITPKGILIKSPKDINLIKSLSLPLVVKPNFEGGSIGITSNNLKNDYHHAASHTLRMLEHFSMPILVEEFVDGIEISVVLFGNKKHVEILDVLELEIEGFNPKKELYGLEIKKNSFIQKRRIPCSALDEAQNSSIRELFLSLDKVDLLRVDGRVKDGQFYVLELTPDVSFEKGCYLSEAFKNRGYSYEGMMKKIVKNATS